MSNWKSPYIVVRLTTDGAATIVNSAATLKDVKYWLQYIALPGDAIFVTPAHPKNADKTEPVYSAHLVARGKVAYSEKDWLRDVLTGRTLQIPSEA